MHSHHASTLAFLLTSIFLASQANAQRPGPFKLHSSLGEFQGARLGSDVGVLSDLNGDGCAEWMAGRRGQQAGSRRPELFVYSGKDGSELYSVPGFGGFGQLFLQAMIDVGDVDGDGTNDIAFGNATAPVGGMANMGRVTVHSGRTGDNLYVTDGVVFFGGFGASLAAIGDVDGDGRPDFAVGQIGTANENAWVVSGATGVLLFSVRGPRGLADPEFGWSMAPTGDLDGDGLGDFAVGTRSGGLVDFISSGKRRRFRRVAGPLGSMGGSMGGSTFGIELSNLGDVNRDGLDDLLVGEPGANAVHIISGRDGSTLARIGADDGVAFGASVAGVGDIDRDQIPDFLVGDDQFRNGRGRVRLYSTRTLRVLHEVVGSRPRDAVGIGVAGGGDHDGDGWPDFVIGADGADRGFPNGGEVSAWSTRIQGPPAWTPPAGGTPGSRRAAGSHRAPGY